MGTRSRLRKKVAPEFTPAPTQNVLQTRLFSPPAKSNIAPTLTDVQAQLDHAQRFGHHLANYATSQHQAATPIIQPKLTIGAPGDKYEQEADRVAQQVVQQLQSPQIDSLHAQPSVQREVMPEEDKLQMKPLVEQIQRETMPEEDELQMKPDVLQREALPEEDELQMKPILQRKDGEAVTADAELENVIQQSRGSGHHIDKILPSKSNTPEPTEVVQTTDATLVQRVEIGEEDKATLSYEALCRFYSDPK